MAGGGVSSIAVHLATARGFGLFFAVAVLRLELRAYTPSHSISPLYDRYFLTNYFSELASGRDPPDLCLRSSWDYRREPPVLVGNCVLRDYRASRDPDANFHQDAAPLHGQKTENQARNNDKGAPLQWSYLFLSPWLIYWLRASQS
jgi:hypothetical protein